MESHFFMNYLFVSELKFEYSQIEDDKLILLLYGIKVLFYSKYSDFFVNRFTSLGTLVQTFIILF